MTSAERDENIPARSLDALVRRAPRAELRSYPGGHFALFEGEPGRRVLADEIDWLARQLDATTRPASSDTGTQASAPRSGGG